MAVELNIITDPWQNFCSATWTGNTMDLTLNSVNQELKAYNAYCKDLGEWRVFFEREEDLTYFLLKWS